MKNFRKKITTKEIGLTPSVLTKKANENDGEVVVMRVYGRISSYESISTNYGESIRYAGTHEAVNMVTEEVYRSRMLFLPTVAETALESMIEKLQDDGIEVQYALDITVSKNDSMQGGREYKFGVKSIIEPKQDDEISRLGQSLNSITDQSGDSAKSKTARKK